MKPAEILAGALADYQGQGAQFRAEREAEPRRLAVIAAASPIAEPASGGFFAGYTEQAAALIAALTARGLDLLPIGSTPPGQMPAGAMRVEVAQAVPGAWPVEMVRLRRSEVPQL